MAEEVEMTPVEMTPVEAAEPPKVNPLAAPGATVSTLKAGLKLPPKPGLGVGLKLPPKPGATVTALKSGLKLPPKPGLGGGLKLPPKPGATVSGLKTGLKLPPKPGLAAGLKLPPKPGATIAAKPLIRKPGATVAAAPIPKPLPKPVVPVDAQGVGKLPTVEAKAINRDEAAVPVDVQKPIEALKTVTQKLKGITQTIPQQAILHKTGIIAETAAQTDVQKEAAKHKTARISLSDAMGVAPVKSSPAPMKTIRIKRPVNLPGSTSATLVPQPRSEEAAPAAAQAPAPAAEATAPASGAPAAAAPAPTEPATSVTQRKTLKIARPGATIRPAGKFGIKRPASQAATVVKNPVDPAQPATQDEVADIPEMPAASAAPVPQPVVEEKPGAGTTISVIFKLAATVAIGALAWFLYENTQLPTYCGGLGWGQ